eukprot:1098135-Rhodomonas_salina.1
MMRSSAGWSRMLLLCLAIGVTHTKVLQEGMELDDEQARKLPDMTDLTVMKTLKCGVCQASVMEMAYGINWAENRKGKKLTEIEKVEVMELVPPLTHSSACVWEGAKHRVSRLWKFYVCSASCDPLIVMHIFCALLGTDAGSVSACPVADPGVCADVRDEGGQVRAGARR